MLSIVFCSNSLRIRLAAGRLAAGRLSLLFGRSRFGSFCGTTPSDCGTAPLCGDCGIDTAPSDCGSSPSDCGNCGSAPPKLSLNAGKELFGKAVFIVFLLLFNTNPYLFLLITK